MKKWLLSIIPLVLLGFIGCRRPAEPEIYVVGQVNNIGNVYVEVLLAPVIPWVTVNQDTIDVDEHHGLATTYEDSISIKAGDPLSLKVDYIEGVATASSKLPGSFGITSHHPLKPAYIPIRSAFTVKWSAATYSDYYRVYFYLEYDYLDTLGNHRSFYFDKDTCVTSTSITFPGSQLFPADVDTVIYSWGDFHVWAMNGPKFEPGSEGNVTGDGIGFFWGISSGGELDIRIEGTKIKEKVRKKLSRRELIEKMFEKAKKIDPNYEALIEALER